jgi:SAM-dependent methyltransferase
MIKYVMTATALKFFSLSPQTRQLYRLLGNTVGQRRRIHNGLSDKYVERARHMLDIYEKFQVLQPGDKLLEIGTGWIHWESTITRLFYDVEITLFDVWDNRQLEAYKHYVRQFADVLDQAFHFKAEQHERAHKLIKGILKAASFDEIYEKLNFKYVINPEGTLEPFADNTFAAIYSSNVLEHVEKRILPAFTQDFYRILQPGGYSIHQIDLGDHLFYYDRSVSPKNYLRYSDKTWRRYFANDVQYFNRVQSPEWSGYFDKAGFITADKESIPADIGPIRADEQYGCLNSQDLSCHTLRVVHRKPGY